MIVRLLNQPHFVKLGNIPPGRLVQLYDEHLVPGIFGIVAEPPTVSKPAREAFRTSAMIVNIETGELTTMNGSTRCVVKYNSAVVLDYTDGPRPG